MATLYNSITCELEAGALAFICSLFSVGGYVTALTFLTLKFFLFSKDLCDNPPPTHSPSSFDSPVGCTGKCFYCGPTSLLGPSLPVTPLLSFQARQHHTVPNLSAGARNVLCG